MAKTDKVQAAKVSKPKKKKQRLEDAVLDNETVPPMQQPVSAEPAGASDKKKDRKRKLQEQMAAAASEPATAPLTDPVHVKPPTEKPKAKVALPDSAKPTPAQPVAAPLKTKKKKKQKDQDTLPDSQNHSVGTAAPSRAETVGKKDKKSKRKKLAGDSSAETALLNGQPSAIALPAPVPAEQPVSKKKKKQKNAGADQLAAAAAAVPDASAAQEPAALPTAKSKKQKQKQQSEAVNGHTPSAQTAAEHTAAEAAAVPTLLPTQVTQAQNAAGTDGLPLTPKKAKKNKKSKQDVELSAAGLQNGVAQAAEPAPAAMTAEADLVEEAAEAEAALADGEGEAWAGRRASAGRAGSAGRSFQRVDAQEWMGQKGSRDNSYAATFGSEGWGAKAQERLGQVRGKDFRHEKTKKKRGSYRGGAIDGAVRSFKYDSD